MSLNAVGLGFYEIKIFMLVLPQLFSYVFYDSVKAEALYPPDFLVFTAGLPSDSMQENSSPDSGCAPSVLQSFG